MRTLAGIVAMAVIFGSDLQTHAERPTEPAEKASYVVTGKVQKVFQRDGDANREYVVQIRVDTVDKGEGYRQGDTIYAYVFQRKPREKVVPSARGHTAVPKEGERIRARIKHARGQMEGLYPDWFDVLEPVSDK